MASGRDSMKRAMFSLAHLEVPELDEALSMGEGLDYIGLVEAKFLGKSHSGGMSTTVTYNYAGIFGKDGEYSVGPFYVYIDPEGVLKGNFDEEQPDDIYEDIGAARQALRNARMASGKQALDAVNEQFNAPTKDPRADKDYVNPFQGKIRSEGKDIDPALYHDLLDAAKDTVAPGANTASDKTAGDGSAVWGFPEDIDSPQAAISYAKKILTDAKVKKTDADGATFGLDALVGQNKGNWKTFKFRGHTRAITLWYANSEIPKALRKGGLKVGGSEKSAGSVNDEGIPFTDPQMEPYRAQWVAFLQKLIPRYRTWGEPKIDEAAGVMTVDMKDHPGYALKVTAEWFGYYDSTYKYEFPSDDEPGMATLIYTLLETAVGEVLDTLAQWEVHHRRGRLMYLPTPRAFAQDTTLMLEGQFDAGEQPLPFNASAVKARYLAYGKKADDDKGIEVHTEPKKLPPSQFRKHIDEDLKEEIAESKKDASSRSMDRG